MKSENIFTLMIIKTDHSLWDVVKVVCRGKHKPFKMLILENKKSLKSMAKLLH